MVTDSELDEFPEWKQAISPGLQLQWNIQHELWIPTLLYVQPILKATDFI